MNWRIHNSCSIRDKAQGPRLSSHNPLDGLSSQPLNYVHNFNLTNDHQKKEVPHLERVLLPEISCKTAAVCLLSFTEKSCWRGFRLCSDLPKMVSAPTAAHCSTNDSTGWKLKKGQQFTLLRRITRLKCVNSEVVLLSTVSLERLSPKGSYHLDGTGMSNTLAQKHLIELLMWNASHVQKQFSKTDRHIWKIWSEKP